MSIIPFLIFAYIAYQIFSSFTKAAAKNNSGQKEPRAKDLMRQMHARNQAANAQRYKNTSPTQRGRENMARNEHNTPWGDSNAATPGARVAANYLKTKTQNTTQLKVKQSARKASHKNLTQHGRRGKNMDQNRHRTDGWGQRGDNGLLNGKNVVILLLVGGGILYWLSHMPAQ